MLRRLSHTPLALFALFVAILGCGLPGRRTPANPAPDFSTATPGGFISVSLRTPTAQGDPALATLNPDQTTPIGPIATATAAAAQAQAATATAQALAERTFNPPASCPDLGSPTTPEQPATFEDYPETIAEYLSLGGPPTVLEATLRSWYETDLGGQEIIGRDFAAAGGLVRADRDFNADTVPDVLLVLPDPGSTRQPPSGDLYLFACQDSVYRLLFQAGHTAQRSAPLIVSADDLLNRGYNQLVYVTETCDGGTCRKEISVRGWGLTLGTFVDMAAGPMTLPGRLAEGLGATVTDTSGDGISEIVVSSPAEPSPEAGPPRPVTEVWTWNGEVFDVSQSISSEAQFRVHAVHDGDRALERGQFEQAVAHYTRVLTDPDLQAWTLPNETAYLQAYALYRLMLTYSVQYDQDRAGSYFDELLATYPPLGVPAEGDGGDGEPAEPGTAGSIYAELAIAFWDAYLLHNDHGLACEEAVAFAQTHPEVLQPLNSFGYANRSYTASDLCPFVIE